MNQFTVRKTIPSLTAAAIVMGSAVAAHAQIDLYVLQVGSGDTITAAYEPFTVRQFSGDLSAVTSTGSWAAPSNDPSDRVTIGGNFTTYAQMNLSLNGSHLAFTGRDVAVGGSTGGDFVIASFNLQNNTFDTSTRIQVSGTSGYRSVASTDGSEFWFTGQGAVEAGGIQYATLGATSSTRVSSVDFQYADLQIMNNDIYATRRAGGTRGVHVWSGNPVTGAPTTTGNVETRVAVQSGSSGWNTGGGTYGSLKFLNESTMFIGTSNAVEVFVRNDLESQAWSRLEGPGQILGGITGNAQISLLKSGDDVYLFYTQGMGTDSSSLSSVLWNTQDQTFGEATLLATADAGYTFGGVVVIPEPSTYALLFGLGMLGTALAIRRRKR